MKIFYNCHIFDQSGDAFVEENGKIIFVGDKEEAFQYDGEHIDLNGKYVYPGFNDSHMHVVNYGQFLSSVSLYEHTTSLQDVLDTLKENLVEGKWLKGRGWNHDYFTDVNRFPTRADLDTVSTTTPIMITRACGHICIANSKAIELANLKEPQEGDTYDLENGIFKENAVYLISDACPQPTVEDIKDYVLKAQDKLHEYGITSVHSDDLLSATSNYKDALTALEQLKDENKLTVRIYEQSHFLDASTIQEFIDAGYNTGVGNEYFKIGPLKVLGDGSLGARTAYLSRPYYDNPNTQGIPIYTKEHLYDMFKTAHTQNMQIAIHAIGDGILDWILDIYNDLLVKYPRDDHRHGVVHCQITREDQLKEFERLNLHAYIQSIFIDYDNHIVEQRVIPETAQTSYNFKTLYDIAHCSNGSDCPVEYPDVLKGIQLAMTRTSIDGTGPYLKEQALSAKEAIYTFTKNGAFGSFEEDVKGMIKEGMYCDFTVLDSEIENTDVNAIKDIKVLETYVAGNCVYKN